jgi:hypothetical protein
MAFTHGCQVSYNRQLAWVALCRRNYDEVIVYHGPCIEIRADWCVEGVWDGDFDEEDLIKLI